MDRRYVIDGTLHQDDQGRSPKYVCRKCLNKIPIVDLDAIIHEELKAFFAAPEQVAV
jgi:hypothetical protein